MSVVLTHKSAPVDAVLEHSRLIVAQNHHHLADLQVPERNRDLVAQLGILADAAASVASAIADNSFEGAPIPHAVVNQLVRDLEKSIAQIRCCLCR